MEYAKIIDYTKRGAVTEWYRDKIGETYAIVTKNETAFLTVQDPNDGFRLIYVKDAEIISDEKIMKDEITMKDKNMKYDESINLWPNSTQDNRVTFNADTPTTRYNIEYHNDGTKAKLTVPCPGVDSKDISVRVRDDIIIEVKSKIFDVDMLKIIDPTSVSVQLSRRIEKVYTSLDRGVLSVEVMLQPKNSSNTYVVNVGENE